ncbi:diacylglyceryl transferase [Desulfonema ishimotonii]|uniref:Diacylglyceryl transferase n=1 Tax=Desulfonema ishimotonii TaxID=45657 RepID=A0A401FY37_9BACT|nr:prolipoprotein diacylglyceryl transferase family protein [Desulfonema ishimotonii]GBC61875.1 diacylglyceryl transferase [Desulfonema ishimotonii]
MTDELFVAGLTAIFAIILGWGFRTLPGENWQILAAMPREKHKNGAWRGDNFTYYGVLNANAYLIGVMIFISLLGAVSVPVIGIVTPVLVLLAICVPASKIVARVVEKKKHTFTVGGAAFVGIVIAPWIVRLTDVTIGRGMGFHLPVLTFLAALSIAYAFGEGVGRLACISFGCCYGKPLSQCHPLLQRLFRKYHFVFSGETKKIAYADGLDGEKVVPIQAVTSILYCGSGILGVWLFLKGWYFTAFFETLVITQCWRTISEFFRADFRGDRKISAYQIMGVVAIFYAAAIALIFPGNPSVRHADIVAGLGCLWHPGMILALQALWAAIFIFTGRSSVTASSLSFHVVRDRI